MATIECDQADARCLKDLDQLVWQRWAIELLSVLDVFCFSIFPEFVAKGSHLFVGIWGSCLVGPCIRVRFSVKCISDVLLHLRDICLNVSASHCDAFRLW